MNWSEVRTLAHRLVILNFTLFSRYHSTVMARRVFRSPHVMHTFFTSTFLISKLESEF